jgi:lysyl endopeptidase
VIILNIIEEKTSTLANRFFIYLMLLIPTIACGQLEREGTPLSWSLGQNFLNHSLWQALPSIDVAALMAEDADNDNRSIPMRFGYAHEVSFQPNNCGQWSNLQNGDRLWVLGISCPDAYAISLTFSFLNIPRGARLYIYSEDHEDYLGPLTAKDNRSSQIGTPPVRGSRIIIEYYEPYAYRGQGDFGIQHVTQSYRDLKDPSTAINYGCFEFVEISPLHNDIVNVSSSVMMMLVDNGQRLATATIINNSSNDATPYVVTSSNALIGNPSSWVFMFEVVGTGCLNESTTCGNASICGAYVVENDIANGILLLKLRNNPKNNWRTYYSGWKLSQQTLESGYTCVQHAYGLPQSLSAYNGVFTPGSLNGIATWNLNPSYSGGTSNGSIGSPLYDQDMNLIGIFVGGDSNCDDQGQDQFAMLSNGWEHFSSYLDPFSMHADRLPGLYPRIADSGSTNKDFDISFFPNPAKDWIYVLNESTYQIQEVIIYDAQGRLISRSKPLVPTINISELPEGFYSILFVASNKVINKSLVVR